MLLGFLKAEHSYNSALEVLELRKVYRILRDVPALRLGLLRVIDEFDEDYLYPREYFTPIELPRAAEKAVFGGN